MSAYLLLDDGIFSKLLFLHFFWVDLKEDLWYGTSEDARHFVRYGWRSFLSAAGMRAFIRMRTRENKTSMGVL